MIRVRSQRNATRAFDTAGGCALFVGAIGIMTVLGMPRMVLAGNVPAVDLPVRGTVDAVIDEALTEFANHNFDEALALFEKAHAMRPTARTLRALAKCHFELRQYVLAIEYMDAALASTVAPLGPELASDMRALRERAVEFTGTVHLRGDAASGVTDLELDGRALPRGVMFRADVGRHTLVVVTGERRETKAFTLKGGESLDLAVEFPPAHPAGGGSAPFSSPLVLTTVAAGAGLGVSIGYFVDRDHAHARCERAQAVGAICADSGSIDNERTLGIGLVGVSGAALAVSTVALVLSAKSSHSARLACGGFTTFGCVLRGSFQ